MTRECSTNNKVPLCILLQVISLPPLPCTCFLESPNLNGVSRLCVLDNRNALTLGGLENPACSATMLYKWDHGDMNDTL